MIGVQTISTSERWLCRGPADTGRLACIGVVAALLFLTSITTTGASPVSASTDIPELCALFPRADVATNDRFGSSIDIQEDTAVVGAWLADVDGVADAGSAHVFAANPSGGWDEVQLLTASLPGPEAAFGFSADLDGDIMAVGAQNEWVTASSSAADSDSQNSGAVYIFERDQNRQWIERARLVLDDPAAADMFGHNVAVDAASQTVVIGAPGRDVLIDDRQVEDAGAVYVYTRTESGVWQPQATLIDPLARPGDRAGNDVDLSGDRAVAGHHLNDRVNGRNVGNAGGVLVYQRDSEGWSEPTRLIGSDAMTRDRAGVAVDIEDDVLVISGWAQGPEDRAVAWVFRETSDGWVEQQRIEPDQIEVVESHYGRHIELEGGVLAVGASMADSTHEDGGAVYLYSERDGIWTEDAKLIPAGTGPGYQAGIALGLSAQWLGVGAERAELGARNGGGACFVPLVDVIGQWSKPSPYVAPGPVAVNRENAGGVLAPVLGQSGTSRRRAAFIVGIAIAGLVVVAGGVLTRRPKRNA